MKHRVQKHHNRLPAAAVDFGSLPAAAACSRKRALRKYMKPDNVLSMRHRAAKWNRLAVSVWFEYAQAV